MTRFALVLLFTVAMPLVAQGRGKESSEVPPGHRPPPGMCRIWIEGVPPGRQPAPTDCPTAIRRRPPNARVIFGDEVRQLRRDRDDSGKHPTPSPVKTAPLRVPDNPPQERGKGKKEVKGPKNSRGFGS